MIKRDDFNFEIINSPFREGDVPRSPSHDVYISQLIRFSILCSNVSNFNNRNQFLTAKLLRQCYRFHKIQILPDTLRVDCKIQYWFKTVLQQGVSEPVFYGGLAY